LIALWRDWAGSPARHSPRIAASLGLFAGQAAGYHAAGDTACAYLPAPRLQHPVRGWQPYRRADGATVLFHGRIDNGAELSDRLGLDAADPAALYGEAVERWGADADFRIIGAYCAIVASADAIRLARSPWDAPPLHYCQFEGQAVAASVPRVLLAAGLPSELDRTRLADNLYFNLLERGRGWYQGSGRVAYGTVVTLRPDGSRRVHDFYDPRALPAVRLARDEDYVEAASALLAEATRLALAGAARPGVMLSGGLDSPILAAEVLRQLPASARLPSFTFAPGEAWRGELPPGLMGDERSLVREFAAMHPRLDPHFTQNPDIQFDSHWDQLFAAIGAAPNHLCNFYVYHGVWQGAREAGCDLMLTADFGNQTYSNEARWAFVEFLLSGRWRQLWLALREHPGDQRPLLQRFAALSMMPLLPRPVRRAIRGFRHPRRQAMNELVSMLPDTERQAARARSKAVGGLIEYDYPFSQSESVAFEYYWRDCEAAEVQQGFEQVYGIRQVDVPAWRPLAEFCAGLPTTQLLRDGETRWLARRMAQGKLPESLRLNRRIGWHNADWHERMTPRLDEFRAEIDRIAGIEELAGLIDPERMRAVVDAWPDKPAHVPEDWIGPAAGLTRGLLSARFIDYVQGRNC
jgi:asparagine synthase (glutamine-hydrolysing)